MLGHRVIVVARVQNIYKCIIFASLDLTIFKHLTENRAHQPTRLIWIFNRKVNWGRKAPTSYFPQIEKSCWSLHSDFPHTRPGRYQPNRRIPNGARVVRLWVGPAQMIGSQSVMKSLPGDTGGLSPYHPYHPRPSADLSGSGENVDPPGIHLLQSTCAALGGICRN